MTDQSALHPEVAGVLELVARADNPAYHEMSAAEARAMHEEHAPALDLPAPSLPLLRDLVLPAPGGELSARLYAPVAQPDGLPVVLWLHGGGHTVGSIACYDSICARLALHSGALVLSLAYRLAPEHRFPAAVDDAFAALVWLSEHAGELGGDAARLAVAGDSAGGNLAAVCALLARDAGLPGLRHQLLVYPAVGADLDYPSHTLFAEDHLLTRRDIEWFRQQYLGNTDRQMDWRFAPLLAASHGGLAAATLIVASHDPLRDEGVAYADTLNAAGTPCELIVAEGMIHAFWNLGAAVRPARRSVEAAARRLALALGSSGVD